jgi:aminopeptidase N
MRTETPRTIRLKDYKPPAYLIDKVDLDVVLDPVRTRVRARLKMRPNPAWSGRLPPLDLDGEGLELESVKLDGQTLAANAHTVSATSLVLRAVPSKPFTLETVVFINPDANTALQGLYRSRGVYCTQCEAQGFRRITYFLDRPDVLATYTVRIEAAMGDAAVLLSNGNPRERGTLDSGRRHYAVWHDPHPKPCYLFALVGGNLATYASDFKTASGRPVALTIYVEPGKEKRCAWAMDSLKRSMRWDEDTFGREYDLDVFNIVAVSDFNMGAMENKGLNIFNDRLVLASPDTATDAAYADIERVIAHEYFHNWTGNRITCRDWFQLCLKEGLTVYRDQEFSADQRSPVVQRINEVRQLKARQFPEDGGPLAHPVRPDHYMEINNFYTATVYEKGAELVRMIATLLGPKDFRRGMDLYFKRHDGDAATVEDFVACFADASKRDLSQFMIWYGQAGTPTLVCNLRYDARAQTADLTIEQMLEPTPGQPKKRPLHLPVRLGLLGADGADLPLVDGQGHALASGVIEVTKRTETFRFTEVPSRPVPSLLRGFSAPANLTVSLSDRELEFLMEHDTDGFNRWQATQDYATRLLVQAVKTMRASGRPERPKAFIAAMGQILGDTHLEPAFKAQILALPGEAAVARAIGRDIDPAVIAAACKGMRRALAASLAGELERLYEQNAVKGAYAPAATQMGQRALRNQALALLATRRRADDIARARQHFETARNATDEVAALAVLADIPGTARTAAFQRYFERWKHDHLVIDTWFSLQATASSASVLAVVKRLTRHPLFAMTNPNKVRSLLFMFASNNPVNFNRPDGAGYQFVADRVVELDAINPQVAARLVGTFKNWRTMEPVRRAAARKVLQQLAKTKPLSRDVFEILTKIIE